MGENRVVFHSYFEVDTERQRFFYILILYSIYFKGDREVFHSYFKEIYDFSKKCRLYFLFDVT
jgi:hypothetical protein